MLTNQHANTTIPEIQGAARAWEVTGDGRWREVVEAYWRSAVVERGYYATGGQTSGEYWTPPRQLSARLGDKNQEHCTVYNMMRVADYLLRWTGEAGYADYWERNLYNGTLAQQNAATGMVAYFLPMRSGSIQAVGHADRQFLVLPWHADPGPIAIPEPHCLRWRRQRPGYFPIHPMRIGIRPSRGRVKLTLSAANDPQPQQQYQLKPGNRTKT